MTLEAEKIKCKVLRLGSTDASISSTYNCPSCRINFPFLKSYIVKLMYSWHGCAHILYMHHAKKRLIIANNATANNSKYLFKFELL